MRAVRSTRCPYSQKSLRPEGLSYRRFIRKRLEPTSTRIVVCARERGLFRADVSRGLNCKKYNLGRENHTKLGY
jgi:hypothetical protein